MITFKSFLGEHRAPTTVEDKIKAILEPAFKEGVANWCKSENGTRKIFIHLNNVSHTNQFIEDVEVKEISIVASTDVRNGQRLTCNAVSVLLDVSEKTGNGRFGPTTFLIFVHPIILTNDVLLQQFDQQVKTIEEACTKSQITVRNLGNGDLEEFWGTVR